MAEAENPKPEKSPAEHRTRTVRRDRRDVLLAAGGVLLGGLSAYALSVSLGGRESRAIATNPKRLYAGPATVPLLGSENAPVSVWAYNGSVPGPLLRLRQGDWLTVKAVNGLDQDTTVHWHGFRLPNAMDGVPHLTQKPIPPGGGFDYAFRALDAGTFWYHPHANSSEQLGRGLSGVVIVDEASPPDVDSDVVWALDDWRLTEDGAIAGDFDALHDRSHAGRLGNFATVSGNPDPHLMVRAGERVRLRLVNLANARIFRLAFNGHAPWLMALDGHPVPPQQLREPITVAPGARADLIIDMTGEPGSRFAVRDVFFPSHAYTLADIIYRDDEPQAIRDQNPSAWAENPVPILPESDLEAAPVHTFNLQGGAMGRLSGAEFQGRQVDLRTLALEHGLVWAVNGRIPMVAGHGQEAEPLLAVKQGDLVRIALRNETAFPHPMHLHGYAFDILKRNGTKLEKPIRRDTVLLGSGETAEIAFVADNPGDWMFHCHVLEHQASGMMGFIRVE